MIFPFFFSASYLYAKLINICFKLYLNAIQMYGEDKGVIQLFNTPANKLCPENVPLFLQAANSQPYQWNLGSYWELSKYEFMYVLIIQPQP